VLADEVRLLTLTGPAGVGKTRLALEIGHDLRSHFTHGVVFVDLTPVRDPDDVLPAVGDELGFRDLDRQLLLQRLRAYLADLELLLILDNLEHVLPAAPVLAELPVAAPRVTLLTTSREALHLRWEHVFHVLPLMLPDPRHSPPLKEFSQIPSVALFLQRARAINPAFALTEDTARAVAELCVHLDGLPLAIELAAARTALLSPQMILERLGQRLSLLRWAAQDLPARQQTLRAAIAWSYDLLSPEEQTLFRRLGVFAGGFSLAAAEAIAASLGLDAIEELATLVDKSLIQVQGKDPDDNRYVFLESMREYALARLAEAGELKEAGRIHARYYLDLAERAETELTGREQRVWFGRLEWAHENLRTALRWLLDHEEPELALRLATALGYFWEARGYMAEGRLQLEEALARAPAADPHLRARALSRLGGLLAWVSSDVEHPTAVLTVALDLARSIQDPSTIARSLSYLGVLGLLTTEWDQSRRHLEESLSYWHEAQHAWGVAYTRLYLGALEFRQEHYQEAMRHLEESLAQYTELGDESARGLALIWLVNCTSEQRDVPGAVAYLQELLELSIQAHDRRLLYLCGAGIASLLRDHGDPQQLAQLLGATRQVREMMGIDRGKIFYTSVVMSTAATSLQARLGQDAFDVALAEGRSLSFGGMATLIQELLDRAIQDGATEEAVKDTKPSSLLSPREQEVLRLVAEGRSNRQIGDELFIAPTTAKYHLTSIFNKLGVDTRAQAVAVAAKRGLL
jgi:non-specific serine/threonine protein kinase